jgi:hypothetical protein
MVVGGRDRLHLAWSTRGGRAEYALLDVGAVRTHDDLRRVAAGLRPGPAGTARTLEPSGSRLGDIATGTGGVWVAWTTERAGHRVTLHVGTRRSIRRRSAEPAVTREGIMRGSELTRRTFCGRVSAALGASGAALGSGAAAIDHVSGPRTYGPATWPAVERLRSQLEVWQRQHPKFYTLETLGRSAQGRPLHAAILTDASAPAGDKEHILITALHSGIERSGTTTVFHIMQWLLVRRVKPARCCE